MSSIEAIYLHAARRQVSISTKDFDKNSDKNHDHCVMIVLINRKMTKGVSEMMTAIKKKGIKR